MSTKKTIKRVSTRRQQKEDNAGCLQNIRDKVLLGLACHLRGMDKSVVCCEKCPYDSDEDGQVHSWEVCVASLLHDAVLLITGVSGARCEDEHKPCE